MSTLTFDLAAFRALCPALSGVADATLSAWWDMATCYVSADNYGWLTDACRQQAINLALAHLIEVTPGLKSAISQGGVGVTQSAQVDKVQVSFVPPPVKSQWGYFWNQSAYGRQLLALLEAAAVGGLYVGGLPERSAFRKVGGIL